MQIGDTVYVTYEKNIKGANVAFVGRIVDVGTVFDRRVYKVEYNDGKEERTGVFSTAQVKKAHK